MSKQQALLQLGELTKEGIKVYLTKEGMEFIMKGSLPPTKVEVK